MSATTESTQAEAACAVVQDFDSNEIGGLIMEEVDQPLPRRVRGWWLAVTVFLVACGQRDAGVGANEPAMTTSDATTFASLATAPTQVAIVSPTSFPVPQTPHDGQLRAEPVASLGGSVCAAVSLDELSTHFCSPSSAFAWSIGGRVFLFSAGPELRLRDGRVLQAEPGNNFVIHEILAENVDNPMNDEPNFCSNLLIAEAFRRYEPSASSGWGGDACISDELFGIGEIEGVDEAGYSQVLGGNVGNDLYIGFVARLDGVWTVLELVPDGEFQGCASLIAPTAKEICARSPAFKDFAATG